MNNTNPLQNSNLSGNNNEFNYTDNISQPSDIQGHSSTNNNNYSSSYDSNNNLSVIDDNNFSAHPSIHGSNFQQNNTTISPSQPTSNGIPNNSDSIPNNQPFNSSDNAPFGFQFTPTSNNTSPPQYVNKDLPRSNNVFPCINYGNFNCHEVKYNIGTISNNTNSDILRQILDNWSSINNPQTRSQ
ncbi:uncharacterized protein OCT59_014763 [Rhizophagus irregularis]|uniref:Uncharacterized protein n=2 Tax=Rhizophagus irregularis TaxID=588596 RepID=A0A015M0H4_RHIIW|nr:hypothetical protein GLOIN_2v1489596 [Rhizophagus irregularis DAOM 181602=DAOM 197198]EXX78486.1 hypothetical protein RirG_014560 [Rhizophagus irregularis DAOM 197198w]UZO22400.1 hypothetical protein OCT59_014763 [Rhizophagus irregularis]POG83122.1 hypothetical protein GLOIN_2v1489596 [Rhizophagus irregularis DAOM 181602=DAOM 197198]CAB5189262.1 unnamed protein product [Rhizophagus irregularis]CAG8569644.1 18095_t:CDS:1 [Rhizophagus irregularis]|eukprot:XP_025189988.1 hypothetical protein GLOIN_2v1489596 [Rhizophagus irregularis DAOM 181602=DAOM 197198]